MTDSTATGRSCRETSLAGQKGVFGRELSIAEFEASPGTARAILGCVMRDVLRDEYRATSNNEPVAVRRAAAWWMTGDPTRYSSAQTGPYTQKVLGFYQRQVRSQSSQTVPQSDYDRHMQAGYRATQKKD